MIRQVSVINHRNERLDIPLSYPEQSELVIRKVTGLGPVKANINITDIVTSDGGIFNSARFTDRNITLDLLFYGEDVEAIRHKIYKFLPVKKKCQLVIEAGHRTSVIDGYVEQVDPNIFSKEEGCTVSIVCPNPYFYANDITYTLFSGVDAGFEFPFCNDSLTDKLLVMGEIKIRSENIISYVGDSDVGMTMHIHLIGPVGDITIWNLDLRKRITLLANRVSTLIGGQTFKARDDIIIKTERGEKSITLYRDGNSYNILGALDKGSEWLRLYKGDNVVAFTTTSGNEHLQFRIENKTLYEGV